jgi:AcrR family transcriptional regulator
MKRTVKKPDERRREIIAASRELFLKKGYEQTTLQDVMHQVKIAKGTTYHYFKSKMELLDAVIMQMVDEYIDAIEKALKQADGDAIDKLQFLIQSSKMKNSRETLEALHQPGNIGLHTKLLATAILRLALIYANIIDQGCQEGLFQVKYPLETAEFLLAGMQFLIDKGCYPWHPAAIDRRLAALPSLFETTLQAKEGSLNFLK